jgi:hypothetical protein
MLTACEDNLGRTWQPRTRLRPVAATAGAQEKTGAAAEEVRNTIQLVTQALRPFAEARAAVVRALRLDLGRLEAPA